MKTLPSPIWSLAKTPLPEDCLLASGSLRAARCLASGGFSHRLRRSGDLLRLVEAAAIDKALRLSGWRMVHFPD